MSYREHLSNLVNQEENRAAGSTVRSISDEVRDHESTSRNTVARDSLLDFMDEVENTATVPLPEINSASRALRFTKKTIEVILPVGVGMAGKYAEAVAGYSGPLAAAAIGGITGATSSAIEFSHVKKSGFGAKEIYQDKVLQREWQREEARSANGVKGALRSAWIMFKDYSTGLKSAALEHGVFGFGGFKVKRRDAEIMQIVTENNIDLENPIYEQIQGLDEATLTELTKKLYVQSVLSGFAEQKNIEKLARRIDLLVSANAAILKKYRNPADADAVLESIWNDAQSEISKIIGRTRIAYIATGAVDRAAKSAMYVLVMGHAVESVRRLFENNAYEVGSNSDHIDSINESLVQNNHDVAIAETLYDQAELRVDEAREAWEAAKATAESHAPSSEGINNKLAELFGEDYSHYLDEGGTGIGSRWNRIDVLTNFHKELGFNPELRDTVNQLAVERGWSPTDMWKAIIMRAQYANGAQEGALSRIVEQIENGTFYGDLNQGLNAAGNIDHRWYELINWAVGEPAATVSNVDVDVALHRYESALDELERWNEIKDGLLDDRVVLLQQALREAAENNSMDTYLVEALNREIDAISTIFGGLVAATMATEVLVDDGEFRRPDLRNPNRNGNSAGWRVINGGPSGGSGPRPTNSGNSRSTPAGGLGGPTASGAEYDPSRDNSTETDWRRHARYTTSHASGPIPNFYQVLGVAPTATIQTIENAVDRILRANLDPTTRLPRSGTEDLLRRTGDAYQVLKRARKAYHVEFFGQQRQSNNRNSNPNPNRGGYNRQQQRGNQNRNSGRRSQGRRPNNNRNPNNNRRRNGVI